MSDYENPSAAQQTPVPALVDGLVALRRAESAFNAAHDPAEAWIDDGIKSLPTLSYGGQDTHPLHEPEVLGCHVALDSAFAGKLSHRVTTSEEHLHHAQAVRMG